MPPILYPAPTSQPDLSDFVVLWHGCTALDKNAIEQQGIDLSQCRVDTDFGRGFYTTTVKRQACLWAWRRFYVWRAQNPKGTGNQPVVLRFRPRRYAIPRSTRPLDRGMDGLRSLHFVRGEFDNEDYWSLVQHCRQSTPAVLCDHRCRPGGWYDLVTGPAAAFWEQRVAMTDSDQVSFHTPKGVNLLQALIDSKHKDNYSWAPVP